MLIAVVSDFHSGIGHPLYCRRILLSLGSDIEKSSLGIVLL